MTAHEQQRLAVSHEYRLLDAPADDELEAVVRVAATVAGVEVADNGPGTVLVTLPEA